MPFRALPQQDKLREMFDYDPDTGILLNKRLSRRAGFVVGGGNSTKKHWAVKVGDYVFTQQRIIWMWVHGKDPGSLLVDHIDQDSLNNRLSNLRLVTRRQNRENSKLNSNNSTGYRGVYKTRGRYQAKLMLPKGRTQHVGMFDTAEEAHEALTKLGKS